MSLRPVMPSLRTTEKDGKSVIAVCFPGDEENELFSLGKGIRRRLVIGDGEKIFEQSSEIKEPIWAARPSLPLHPRL